MYFIVYIFLNFFSENIIRIIRRNMLIRGALMKFSLTALTGEKIVATASQPFCHFTLEVFVNSGT